MRIPSILRTRAAGVVALSAASMALLLACAGAMHSDESSTGPAATPTPLTQPMAPGMTMPDGSIMGADAPEASGPSPEAAMICSAEFRHDLAEALAVHSVPAGTSTWRDSLYSCAYRLFGGRLVLSVKDLPSAAGTDAYFAARRDALPDVRMLDGLTFGAFGDGSAIVVLRKDDHVLTVDATAMPAVFGREDNKRADFAYEVAAVVLGCWTGD